MIQIVTLLIITFIASLLGTVIGFGISTLMTPLLLLFFPTKQTILFIAIIHWANDIWKIALFPKKINRMFLWYFGMPTVLATALGSLFVFLMPVKVITQIVGILLIISIVARQIYRRFFMQPSLMTIAGLGISAGFFAGLTGIRGELIASMIAFFKVPKEVYIATLGAINFIIDATRIIIYKVGGINLEWYQWLLVLICIPISYAGAILGTKLVRRISQEWFNRLITIVIFILGIKLLIWP